MTLMTFLTLAAGLGALLVGADFLVRGASTLARMLGVPPVIVGLTVVAFGTSAPELAVSVQAVLMHAPSLSLGNAVGSNIFNILAILGVSALIRPLAVENRLVRIDVPFMIAVSVLLYLAGRNGVIGRGAGMLFLALLAGYVWWLIRKSPRDGIDSYTAPGGDPHSNHKIGQSLAGILAGLAMLVLGSRWLNGSAVTIAETLGVGRLVIGLTIVAASTSLPELMTSVIAAIRGEQSIAVGNVIGSNIFNILGVIGCAAAISPDGLAVETAALSGDIPVMIAAAMLCLPVFFTGPVIARWEGALFLGYYVAYTAYLFLAGTTNPVLAGFTALMARGVIPLTVLTLTGSMLWNLHRPRRNTL